MLDLARARDRMVDVQIAARGVRDRYVLEAMRRVPRDAFVEPGFEEFAYERCGRDCSNGCVVSDVPRQASHLLTPDRSTRGSASLQVQILTQFAVRLGFGT